MDEEAETFLGKYVKVILDRPIGSIHPSGEPVYPINYGFVPNTIAGDGMEQDAYILGVSEACKEYYGFCAAVLKRHNDVENKLIVVPNEEFAASLMDESILEATAFIEQYFEISLIMNRN